MRDEAGRWDGARGREVGGWVDGGGMAGWGMLDEVDLGWLDRTMEEEDLMVPHDDEWADRERAKETPGAAMR